MHANFDTEKIELTERFIDALKELMAAEREMMITNWPEQANYWRNGRCAINDLALSNGLEFHYGGNDDFEDELGEFAVVSG